MKLTLSEMIVPVIAVLAHAGAAGVPDAPPDFDPRRHMRVSEVRDGMKGYGLSVFRGTKIERFEVEVVSVLRNFNPKHDVVLVRCRGANLEHTGAVAGMSGSPVFLRDDQGRERLIGAFAYGWTMMKDPVGGVQPIEYMLRLPSEPAPGTETGAQGTSRTDGTCWHLPATFARRSHRPEASPEAIADASSRRQPLREMLTPLMISGMPAGVVKEFEPMLLAGRMSPVLAGGAGGAAQGVAAGIEPGAVIAIPLVSGDGQITGIGTVTEVIGGRVLAFGHALQGEGDVLLPMGSGYVHMVAASLVNSFKVASFLELKGTLHCDQLAGVAGRIGMPPPTVPVEIRCRYEDGSSERLYRFNVAQHPRLTAVMAAMCTAAAIASARDLPVRHTLDVDLTMEFANGRTLRLRNRLTNTSPMEVAMSVAQSVQAAAENPFSRVMLRKLSGEVVVSRDVRMAEILSVGLPRARYAPGETIKAFVTYRPFQKPDGVMPIELSLPRDLPDGSYELAVMDWQNHLSDEQTSRPFRFSAHSAAEVFDVLSDFLGVRRDALYVRLMRQPDGIAVGRTAMPRLPSSRRRVLLGANMSDITLFASPVLRVVPTGYVMDGQARFTIVVDRKLQPGTQP